MKKIIFYISLLISAIIISCNVDPYGIEDNILIDTLKKAVIDTTGKEPPKPIVTKFEADSISIEFKEKAGLFGKDPKPWKWETMFKEKRATIDTARGINCLWFDLKTSGFLNTSKDSIFPEIRKEQVEGLQLKLDSFLIPTEPEFQSEENKNGYFSELFIFTNHHFSSLGKYHITIKIEKPFIIDSNLIVEGNFDIVVPQEGQPKKYTYNFLGNFRINFPLK